MTVKRRKHLRALCPHCERVITMNYDGTFRAHRALPGYLPCPGTHQRVAFEQFTGGYVG